MIYILEKNIHWQEKELNGEPVVIPKDWNNDALGTLFKIVGGGTPTSNEPKFWDGDIPWLGPKDMGTNQLLIKEGTRFLSDIGAKKLGRRVKQNSVIVSTRAPVGYINIAENDLYTNQGCQSLYSEAFNSVYVAQWLRLNKWILDKNSAGSTFKELSSSNLKKIHIWFPYLTEQTAIANILSDQESLIAHCNDLIALHEKRFAYLSDELLSGRLRLKIELDGKLNLSSNNDWQSLNVNKKECMTPTDWQVKPVSDLAYEITTGKKDANAAVEGGAYTFFTCGEKDLAIDVYSFDTAALVLNGNGNVGEVKMANGKFDAYQRNYVLTAGLPLKYGYYVFKTYFKDAVNLSGSVMPYITLKDLQNFDIRIPLVQEQTAIANVLSDQEALIAQYKTLRDAEKKRFDWLSDALLSGTYRVKVES